MKTELFYNSSLPTAFRQALKYGKVASMSVLLSLWDKNPEFRNSWYTANSENLIGLDSEGRFGKKDSPVAIATHGARILTPDRIEQAYKEGLNNVYAAKLTPEEIRKVLSEKNIYSIDDIMKGKVPNGLSYAIVMPLETAAQSNSGYQDIDPLLGNKVFVANCGSLQSAETHIKTLKSLGKTKYGSRHRFNVKPELQGRLLFLGYDDDGGLNGGYCLDYVGRFVGVHSVSSEAANTQVLVPKEMTYQQVMRLVRPFVAKSRQKGLEEKLRPRFTE